MMVHKGNEIPPEYDINHLYLNKISKFEKDLYCFCTKDDQCLLKLSKSICHLREFTKVKLTQQKWWMTFIEWFNLLTWSFNGIQSAQTSPSFQWDSIARLCRHTARHRGMSFRSKAQKDQPFLHSQSIVICGTAFINTTFALSEPNLEDFQKSRFLLDPHLCGGGHRPGCICLHF